MKKMVEVHGLLFITILTAFLLIIGLFRLVFYWKNLSDKKNIRLMCLYLELKFLYKNIDSGLNSSNNSNYCLKLIDAIKEYYDFEEVLILNSKENKNSFIKDVNLRLFLYSFFEQKEEEFKFKLLSENVIIQDLQFLDKKYIIYIFLVNPKEINKGFIVCIENYPALLSKDELLELEININLLKTKLLNN